MICRVVLWAISVSAAVAQTANPFATDVQATGTGKGIFRIYCAPCHGIRGQGGRGPDLSRGSFSSGEHDSDLFRTISTGVAGTEMESYAGTLSDDNIWRVVAYIRSMSSGRAPQAAAGDPRRGKELFWGKGGCGSCHAVNGKGGRSGPDLSRAGRQRSAEFLRTSIVDPNLDITPGYQTITVVTRDGSTVSGIERGFDNFTAQIMDSSGRFYSFDKTELTSIRRDSRSPMPESYGRTLTSSEIDDLVSYLLTLRGAAK